MHRPRLVEPRRIAQPQPLPRPLIAENARTLGCEDSVCVLRQDASKLKQAAGPFELVLMDAPYGRGLSEAVLAALAAQGWLSPDAQLVIELAADEPFQAPPGYDEEQRRRYGTSQLVFLRLEPS